jgi:alkanesulfonate monooxygenase SsuD/methylene tetrahydromethanopterin reductase-like flavin-dependent oxidoreductase (luciferase family)
MIPSRSQRPSPASTTSRVGAWNLEEMADHGVPVNRRRAVLRDYLQAMQTLWRDDVASYEGEYVRFGPSWAWPKPIQTRIPVVVGAFGNDKTFDWIVQSADGWITTPIEEDLGGSIARLRSRWTDAGRAGEPQVIALETTAAKRLAEYRQLGVTEALVSLPDVGREQALRHLDRLTSAIESHREAWS